MFCFTFLFYFNPYRDSRRKRLSLKSLIIYEPFNFLTIKSIIACVPESKRTIKSNLYCSENRCFSCTIKTAYKYNRLILIYGEIKYCLPLIGTEIIKRQLGYLHCLSPSVNQNEATADSKAFQDPYALS